MRIVKFLFFNVKLMFSYRMQSAAISLIESAFRLATIAKLDFGLFLPCQTHLLPRNHCNDEF